MALKLSYTLLPALLLTVFSCTREFTGEPVAAVPSQESHSGVILVELSEELTTKVEADFTKGNFLGTKSGPVNSALSSIGAVKVERLFEDGGEWEPRHREAGLHRYYRIVYDPACTDSKAAAALESVSGILGSEPELPVRTDAVFNDPGLKYQWHYINPGNKDKNNPLSTGCDVNVEPVWEKYSGGSSQVIVAVIDGGIDTSHPDIGSVVIPGGSDGSKNFVDNNYTIVAHNHGTHVGGTIGAINNNGVGVCGIAGGKDGKGGVRLLSCQVFKTGSNGKDISSGHYNALIWAADHGAVLANNSWSVAYDNAAAAAASSVGYYKTAIDYFIKNAGCDKKGNQRPDSPMKGGLVFFSAGNNNWPDGWPAEYSAQEPRCVSVGAVGPTFTKTYYSSYGDWVSVCAPGGDANVNGNTIYSTRISNSYGYMQGTSMSCPHATGVAALVLSNCGGPGFTNDMLLKKLLNGARQGVVKPANAKIGPLIDAFRALCYDEPIPPDDITSFKVSSESPTSLTFKFNVSVDDSDGRPEGYLLLATKKVTFFNGLDPKNIPEEVEWTDIKVGDLEVGALISGTIEGLEPGTRYQTTVIAYDKSGLYSKIAKKNAAYTKSAPANPPVLSSDYAGDGKVGPNGVLNIDFTASDPDGDLSDVGIVAGGEGAALLTLSTGSYRLSIAGGKAPAGKYSAEIKASDTGGRTAGKVFEYEILPNRAPVITVTRESATSWLVSVADPDGDEFGIGFTPGSKAAASDKAGAATWRMTVSSEAGTAGHFVATYTATDIHGATATYNIPYIRE